MKAALTSLAFSVLALCGGTANAQLRGALVQDVERPTAQTIVSAHCAYNNVTTCPVYTVPAGKILHVTQLGYYITNSGGFLQFAMSNFTSLFYPIANGNLLGSSQVDLYVPAGVTVVANTPAGPGTTSIDVSLFGTLSDQ